MITLEPDQERLVGGVKDSMRAGNKWVLMQAATGAGKTYMGASIIKGTQQKGKRCMITVPRKELLKQTASAMREFDIPFSYIAGGHQMNPLASVFLATTQTLSRRIAAGTAPKIDLIMPDETHWGGAELDSVIRHYKAQGAWGVGLSATPLFANGRGMQCWYDDLVQGESIRWLIEAGRLSSYKIFDPESRDQARATSGKKKLVGDEVASYRQNAMGKLAIVYCESIAHSKKMAEKFNAAGIPAANIDGYMPEEERKKIIISYARREILVLCNAMLLTFGFDLKSASGMDAVIEVMIDSAPCESLALQMQKWGRVLRKKPFPALIFDHAGNRYRHGYPDDERHWSLAGADVDFNTSAGGVSVQNCSGGTSEPNGAGKEMPACYFSHPPAPRCPNCGAWYDASAKTIQSIAGELTEKEKPPRRPFTPEEIERLSATIDRMTKNGINRGMPVFAAKKWAKQKATEQLEEKIDRETQLSITLHAGDQQITI